MNFSREQKRIIKSKCNGQRLLKGNTGCGKTCAAINRIHVLTKSYCIEDNDKVLLLGFDTEHKNSLEYAYKNIEKAKFEQRSFFDDINHDKLNISEINDITMLLFEQYKKENKLNKHIISEDERLEYISKAIESVKEEIKLIHKYEKKNIFNAEIISKEIKFIKESNYKSLSEYQTGFTSNYLNIRRNSKFREMVYEILTRYNNMLDENNELDNEDINILALMQSEKHNLKYTHIIIDKVQNYSKITLDILKNIYLEKSYSSILFILDNDKLEDSIGWLNKKRKFKTLGYNMTGKTSNFKTPIEDYIKSAEEKTIDLKISKTVEKLERKDSDFDIKEDRNMGVTCQYIDLNRKVYHEFIKDEYDEKCIYTSDDNFKEKNENTITVPVYNEIAAGSPIPMNDELEDNIVLPREWVRTDKNVFVLKIKGDSMVNKNINDGDFVVINKNKYPSNYDVVAVEIEGEATLKTFKSKGKTVTLMPENEKYDPIILTGDKECSLLGVAIGIIKHN